MSKSKKAKRTIDGDIISFLMLADNEMTATQIAQGIGLNRAKDVNSRLTSLNNRNIVGRIKANHSVYWSVEQTPNKPAKENSYPVSTPENTNITETPSIIRNDASTISQLSGGYEALVNIVENLRDEIVSLCEKVKTLEIIIARDIPIENSSVFTSPTQTQPDTNSWATADKCRTKLTSVVSAQPPDKSATLVASPLPTFTNRYAPLAFINNRGDVENTDDDQKDPGNKFIASNNNSPPKIVKIIPGKKSYAESHLSKISIVSDSMSSGIRQNDINEYLDGSVEKIILNKFHGAHADQIKHYSKYTIENDGISDLVICAGANDLSYDFYNGVANAEVIANRILDIGRDAKREGVANIHVCGIMKRRDTRFLTLGASVNCILRLKCHLEGFTFIDNSNIYSTSDISADGLHLNFSGSFKLKHNILRSCSKTYNPYMNHDTSLCNIFYP